MYCFHLNLDLAPFKFKFNHRDYLPKFGKTSNVVKFNLVDINPELVELLAERNIKIGWAEMFIKHPHMTVNEQIHIDEFRGDFVKLNWVWGGTGSTMRWFQELDPAKKLTPSSNQINSPYLGFSINDVVLEHEEALSGPCIIQVGVPHNVVMGTDMRWALSFVLLDITGNTSARRRLSMSRALENLSNLRKA
jgi:hypothetical protein